MVTSLLLYLLKANLVLLLFAAAYFGLLRRLTFFSLNRAYLLLALGFAAVYPALPVPALLPAEAVAPVAYVVLETTGAAVPAVVAPAAPTINWAALGLFAYGAGTALLLLRLLVQLLSLGQLRRQSRPATVDGQAVRVLPGLVSPFSFGRSIYLNPAQHPAPELAAVLRHELVHVRQWHTLDVLLAQLALAAAWCNPAAWLLRRALLDNLEYLADHAVLATGLDRRAYQYSLLRLSHAAPGPSLVSHFTFPTLKNRVVMMNLPLSSSGKLARYIVAGPLVLAVALGISGARAQGAGPVASVVARVAHAQALTTDDQSLYYVDGQPFQMKDISEDVYKRLATMKILKGAQVQQALGSGVRAERVVVMVTKENMNRPDVVALDKKVDAAGGLDTHIKISPGVSPAKHQLPDGIKAYIAQTYPTAKITAWFVSDKPGPKAPHIRYYASIAEPNGEKRKLYFNGDEQLVEGPAGVPSAPTSSSAPAAAMAAPAARSLKLPGRSMPPLMYVDGQRYAGDMNDVGANNIANISVFKGEKARQLFGADAADGVLVVTTIINQHDPEVRAFNEKVAVSFPVAAPASAATGTPYLAAPALAYITKNYPDARLMSVTEIKAENGGPMRYQAQIVIGRRPGYLLFDGLGQFISESSTSYSK